jgi:hypothetical protein
MTDYSVLHPAFCIMDRMIEPEPEQPAWKKRAVEIEYWIVTAVVTGAFVVGLIAAVRAL